VGEGQRAVKKRKTYRRTFIREWRPYRHFTQERLARAVGVSVGLISLLERGKSPYSQALLEAIAGALSCPPADLLIRNPNDPEGLWSLWDGLEATERKQAISVLRAIKPR
jgi:transcriptional regulator with XRE-family HTH domain